MAYVQLLQNQPVLTKSIHQVDDFNVSFDNGNRVSVIEGKLPFRIRFTAIQIPTFSPSTVPPIPLQIIGFSNYIL